MVTTRTIIISAVAGAVLIFLFYLLIRKIVRAKKSVSDPSQKAAQSNVEAKANDPKTQQVGTNQIKVTIFTDLGGGLVAQVGDPIICTEKPDEHTNLLVINEERNFKEDFNFQKDRIFETLEFALKIQNKNRNERKQIISVEIKKQEELVNSLKTNKELNAKYNYQDESYKLRQLKVMREALQMETFGNYMRLGKGGIRQFEFVAIDGILYPYFFGSQWYRVYPDLQIKKKIFNQENTIFRNEIGKLQGNILNWMMIIVLVVGILMMGLAGWMMNHAYTKNGEITLTANQGAISCTNTLASINSNYATIIEDYQELKAQQTESIKNAQNPNINTGGNLIIDPNNIIG